MNIHYYEFKFKFTRKFLEKKYGHLDWMEVIIIRRSAWMEDSSRDRYVFFDLQMRKNG